MWGEAVAGDLGGQGGSLAVQVLGWPVRKPLEERGGTAVLEVARCTVAVPGVPSDPEFWGLWDIILVSCSAQIVYKRKCSSPHSFIWFTWTLFIWSLWKACGICRHWRLRGIFPVTATCAHVCLRTPGRRPGQPGVVSRSLGRPSSGSYLEQPPQA